MYMATLNSSRSNRAGRSVARVDSSKRFDTGLMSTTDADSGAIDAAESVIARTVSDKPQDFLQRARQAGGE